MEQERTHGKGIFTRLREAVFGERIHKVKPYPPEQLEKFHRHLAAGTLDEYYRERHPEWTPAQVAREVEGMNITGLIEQYEALEKERGDTHPEVRRLSKEIRHRRLVLMGDEADDGELE